VCRAATRLCLSAKKNPGHFAGQTIRVERIGAFGQSNRVSGNGTTLLLAVTPAQRVSCAGAEVSTEVMPDVLLDEA
jgi:hypothetical protein